jgi:hypothetical protein
MDEDLLCSHVSLSERKKSRKKNIIFFFEHETNDTRKKKRVLSMVILEIELMVIFWVI